jgi:hypothetical protein
LEFVRLIGQNFLAVCSNERQSTEQEMDGIYVLITRDKDVAEAANKAVAKHHTGDN